MKLRWSRKSHRQLGDAARDARNWFDAAHHYDIYLRARPGDFGIWVQYGHALKECGRTIDALVAYSEAMAINPDDADLLLNVGRLYQIMGHESVAREFYLRSFKADGNEQSREELAHITRLMAAGRADDLCIDASLDVKRGDEVPK